MTLVKGCSSSEPKANGSRPWLQIGGNRVISQPAVEARVGRNVGKPLSEKKLYFFEGTEKNFSFF